MKAWSEFKNWVKYVREYKDNKDNDLVSANQLRDANNTIELLKNEIKQKDYIAKETQDLLCKRNDRVRILTDRLTDEKTKNKFHLESIGELETQLDDYEKEIIEKNKTIKKVNMKYAQSQRMIQKLEKDIQRKDHKINFLLASKEAPSKEKVMAYEKCMKEVEKKAKK